MEISRQLRSIIALPLMVTIIIPAILVLLFNVDHFSFKRPFPMSLMLSSVGFGAIIVGLILMIATIRLFINKGNGTLAPWDPPSKLVISGPYRYVRNPMIMGVFSVLLGEAMIIGSTASWIWFILFLLMNLIYIPMYEERGLEERFGHDYRLYKQNVPRWIPRLNAWRTSTGEVRD